MKIKTNFNQICTTLFATNIYVTKLNQIQMLKCEWRLEHPTLYNFLRFQKITFYQIENLFTKSKGLAFCGIHDWKLVIPTLRLVRPNWY